MISLKEYAAMGVKVTVDHKVRKTKGCRTFFGKAKNSASFIGSSKPVGYSKMTFGGING
jgi:hypothetical protein